MKKTNLVIMALAAMFITTGCAGNQATFTAAPGGTTGSGGKRIAGYKKVTREKVVQAAPPVRIEPDPGTWNGEAAIRYAEENNIHGARFKPCHSTPTGMCIGNEPWMTASELRSFYRNQGKSSPYCGATWVQGMDAKIPYEDSEPIYEDIPVETASAPAIVNNQTTTWEFAPQLNVHGTFAPSLQEGYAGYAYGGSRPIFGRAPMPYPRHPGYVPRPPERRPCMVCRIPHSGPCRHAHHSQQSRGRTIFRLHDESENHNLIIRNAPPGYRPSSYGSSGRSGSYRPGGSYTSRGGGFRGNNPGVKYYRR